MRQLRIGVIGNCNVDGIGAGLSYIVPSARIFALELPALRRKNAFDSGAEILKSCDIVSSQQLNSSFGPLSSDSLRNSVNNFYIIPSISFTGFHPDCVYLIHEGKQYPSPLGAYHSAIIAACYSLSIHQERVLDLFNAYIFKNSVTSLNSRNP